MTTAELRALIEELMEEYGEYQYFGIRTQDVPFELGEIDHNSKVWEDGDETDEELDGISATNATSGSISAHIDGLYYGDHMAILASNDITWGEDVDELVMRDAVVIRIIR